ncbi:universal stress protein [Sphingomonas sp. LY54]|uniref:universal stress protein n=1 Tax=Sphingomonas sp. LY54 TaxID=3095343 RepID=UPI002D77986A|nr:universal stress protein [Sphingomonas sp. LY54]WRP29911.1 universal stress protein [Sphingomonas sp. LY54]
MRILAATDFSTRSDRALLRAVLLARVAGATLTLLHAVDDDRPAYMIASQRDAAATLLRETTQAIADVDGITADFAVAAGDAFAAILQAADEVDADLIVVGPHRRQLLDMFVGTTAERTIRRSRRPVLMANAVPAGPYRRSLLALDLDTASRAAVMGARRLGLLDQSEAIALHLFDAPAAGMMKRAMEVPAAIDHYVGAEERRAAADFDAFLAEVGPPRPQRLLRPARGSPAGAILGCAKERDVDLIVVGTNQRKGLQRLMLGSVAQDVLVDAPCDVLVVPAADEEDAASARP